MEDGAHQIDLFLEDVKVILMRVKPEPVHMLFGVKTVFEGVLVAGLGAAFAFWSRYLVVLG